MRLIAGSILVVLALASGCARTLVRYQYAELHMGVQVRLTVYANSDQQARDACCNAYARVAELEQIMSDYRPNSELMRMCRSATTRPTRVSPELFFVLSRAQELSSQSHGAFDVTVGPLVTLWRTARKTGALPPAQQLAQARENVGWTLLKLDSSARTVRLLRPGMRLDLGGIAKGFAGDEAISVLRASGVRRALFEAGGDIVAGDPPPGKRGWTIDIPCDSPPCQITLANSALSTSGDTSQFVIIDKTRYSHVVDPRTGLGLTNRVLVTVRAPDGITSDSLSTALSVLGTADRQQLLREYPSASAHVRNLDDGQ
jgi:thiamine biosynthesis lipoprotein